MIHIAICEDIETHANKMKELLTAVLPKNITLTHYTSGKEMLSDIQDSHIIYDLAMHRESLSHHDYLNTARTYRSSLSVNI